MGQLTGCRETTDALPHSSVTGTTNQACDQPNSRAQAANIGGKNNGNSNRKQYRWQGRCPLFQVQGSRPG